MLTGITSVGAHLRLERDLYLAQFSEEDRHCRMLAFEYLMTRETCITGAGNLDFLDLAEVGSYTELPGGNISLPTGFSSVLTPLASQIPADKILTGVPVKVIRWDSSSDPDCGDSETVNKLVNRDHHLLSSDINCEPKIEILCDNGKCFYADSVICTFPLGVLKQHRNTLFDPPLPDNKLKSIDKLRFGTVDKIYLEYDRPFFSAELSEAILLWEPIDPSEDISSRWFKKIYSFTKMDETLLLGWISGEEAKFMETLPFEAVAEQCTLILRQFLDDPYIPKPKRCIWLVGHPIWCHKY